MRTHLVIPDSHCEPEVPNDRYEWLGRFILDLRPDVIINLGDHADMSSLGSYDVGKKSFEGRTYHKDIEHVRNSLKRLHAPIEKYNRARARNKKAQYRPRWEFLLGNHEDRINRAVEADRKLEDLITTKDLGYEDYGWKVHPFKTPVEIDGVFYCHYFVSGVMGRAIGGENAARALISKQHVSCTVGHSHLRDFAERTRPDGQRVQGLVAGCYFEHSHAFAGPANTLYWRGVVVKRNVRKGMYDHEWVSIDTLKQRYAK